MTPHRAELAAATRVEPAAFDVDGTTLVGDLHLPASSAQDRSPAPWSQSALESFRPYAVTLSVLDLEGTARWYREKLGFREVKPKAIRSSPPLGARRTPTWECVSSSSATG